MGVKYGWLPHHLEYHRLCNKFAPVVSFGAASLPRKALAELAHRGWPIVAGLAGLLYQSWPNPNGVLNGV